jgi:hypothetical protein
MSWDAKDADEKFKDLSARGISPQSPQRTQRENLPPSLCSLRALWQTLCSSQRAIAEGIKNRLRVALNMDFLRQFKMRFV